MCAYHPFVLTAAHQPSSLSTLMFNDSVTLGLSDNPDDLRSYGMQLSFHHESGWELYSSIFGLTYRDRFDQTGGRYDEFIIQGGRLFHFHLGDGVPQMMFDLAPYVGLTLFGKLGLDVVQNFVHESLDINPVHLDYESDDIQVAPHFGSRMAFVYKEPVPWFSVSDLVFRAEVEFSHALSYVSTVYTRVSVGQETPKVSDFMAGLGYSWAHVYDDWFSHEVVTMSETGIIAFLRWHFGVLSFSYQWYLDRLQGYGGMGFDISFGENIPWERNDIMLSMGAMFPEGMTTTTIRYSIFKDASVSLMNMFKMIPLDPDERTREIVSTWMTGFDYEFSALDIGWMRPFAAIDMGITRVLVMEDDDSNTDTVVDSNGRVRGYTAVGFSGDIQAGVRFFPNGRLQFQGVAYGLEVSAGLLFKDLADSDRYGTYELELMETWLPYVRIGVTAGSHL